MSWNPIEQAQDYATFLGRHRTPGICEIVNASSLRRWDVPEGFGIAGADMKYNGLKVAKFSVRLSLYSVADWAAWDAFRRAVLTPPKRQHSKGSSGAMDIEHPVLAAVDIRACVVEEVLAPEQVDDGVWSIVIKCIEWRKPQPALARPAGPAATPVDERTADEIELDRRREQYQALHLRAL